MKISKKLLKKLGSTKPEKFINEAIKIDLEEIGHIKGLRHVRVQNIKCVIEDLKKFKKEYPDAKVTSFVFYNG